MINVHNIVNSINSALDAEGFDRYRFDEDFKPAINYAKDWLVTAFSRAFDENKFTKESLRELIRVRVFIASIYSRINLMPSEMNEELWSILAVYPKPEIAGNLPNINLTSEEISSLWCPQASYIRSNYSAKRITLEEVNVNRKNPFMAGNNIVECAESKQYAYLAFADYTGVYSVSPAWEIEILPSVPLETVAVAYLAYPKRVQLITDILPFPESLENLIVNKALSWISYKQGDNTHLRGVTDQDLNILMQLMT